MLNRLQDVFRCFQEHDVRYLVIGGVASILHAVPRATFDLDIPIEATPKNANRLLEALLEAGLPTTAAEDPAEPGRRGRDGEAFAGIPPRPAGAKRSAGLWLRQ